MAETMIVTAILNRLLIVCLRILLRGGKPAARVTQVADYKHRHDQEKYRKHSPDRLHLHLLAVHIGRLVLLLNFLFLSPLFDLPARRANRFER